MMAELGQLILSSSVRSRGPRDTGRAKGGRGVSGAEFGAGREQGPRG